MKNLIPFLSNFSLYGLSSFLFIPFLSPSLSLAIAPTETLFLDVSKNYQLNSSGDTKEFFLLSNSGQEASVKVQNNLAPLKIEIECDGKAYKKFSLGLNKSKKLKFPQIINSCVLKMLGQEDFNEEDPHKINPRRESNSRATRGENLSRQRRSLELSSWVHLGSINLIKDEKAYPILKKFNSQKVNCNYVPAKSEGEEHTEKPQASKVSSVEEFFLTNNYSMLGCANSSARVELLTDMKDGVLSKLEALLGYKPDSSIVKNQNPYVKLDFSKAPRLDAIFISTLLFRHDFTGTILAQALKFHAKRGALINIVGTGYMQDKKDKALLKELVLLGGNVRIQEYKYKGKSLNLSSLRFLTNYLRDFHVKMFITISHSDPQSNIVITGGRNIHDGFIFDEKTNLSAFPELQQDKSFVFWKDLEIKIHSKELAESIYSDLTRLWNRNDKGQIVQGNFANKSVDSVDWIEGEDVLKAPLMMRHFLSVPFADNHALEKFYIEMLDSAQNSIYLSSPYLRPTKSIMQALERAIKRGVQITIQTRINLEGDTASWLYEEANKAAINELFDKVAVYEWKENSILHTKLLIIDNNLAFLSSVNLSRRSFIQDIESGLLIHDHQFVGDLTNLLKDYASHSRIITDHQKRKFWASVIMAILKNQF